MNSRFQVRCHGELPSWGQAFPLKRKEILVLMVPALFRLNSWEELNGLRNKMQQLGNSSKISSPNLIILKMHNINSSTINTFWPNLLWIIMLAVISMLIMLTILKISDEGISIQWVLYLCSTIHTIRFHCLVMSLLAIAASLIG